MTKRAHGRMRSAVRAGLAMAGLVTMASAGGCADDSLDRLAAPADDELHSNADLVAAEINLAIDDALTRIVPSLSDPAGAEPLRAMLATLQNHLGAGNAKGAAGTITAVTSLIEAYESNDPDGPDAPDLEAIRLAVGAI